MPDPPAAARRSAVAAWSRVLPWHRFAGHAGRTLSIRRYNGLLRPGAPLSAWEDFMRFFRLSPSRLAAGCVVLCVLVLALFAVPLWYAWRINYSTFKLYVEAGAQQELVDTFQRQGPQGLASAIQSRLASPEGDEILFLAGPDRSRIAGNLQAWPADMPD